MTWDNIARQQGGAISRGQILDAGLPRGQLARLIASNQLVRQDRGVFVARGAPVTYLTSIWITILRTGGVLGFATAVHLWGAIDPPPWIDVIVDPRRRMSPRSRERLHRVSVPDAEITTVQGLPITSRRWSILDYAGRLSIAEAVRFLDRALQKRWLTKADISRRVNDHPFRTGNTVLRRVLAITGDGAAAESERRLHALLRSAGIGGWRANWELRVGGSVVAVLDVAFLEFWLALEIDGMAFHIDVDRFVHDRRRQNAIVALGWTVLRFTWWDLVDRPDYVIATIRRHLETSSADRGA